MSVKKLVFMDIRTEQFYKCDDIIFTSDINQAKTYTHRKETRDIFDNITVMSKRKLVPVEVEVSVVVTKKSDYFEKLDLIDRETYDMYMALSIDEMEKLPDDQFKEFKKLRKKFNKKD